LRGFGSESFVEDDGALAGLVVEAVVGDANGDEVVERYGAAGIPGFAGHGGALLGCEGSDRGADERVLRVRGECDSNDDKEQTE